MVEVEVLQRLRAGKRAARTRISPPLDWRAATSRSRQAARNSSWLQAAARARSASRSTAAASDGVFNARTGRPDRPKVGSWWSKPSGDPGDLVIDGQVSLLDLVGISRAGGQPGQSEWGSSLQEANLTPSNK